MTFKPIFFDEAASLQLQIQLFLPYVYVNIQGNTILQQWL